MNNGSILPRLIVSVIATLIFAGCAGSPQVRFYLLSPLVPQEGNASPKTPTPVSVGVAPVEIPDYLNRPQIVTRDGRNELNLAEFDRWGGSLPDNIASVMTENLSLLLGSDRVQTVPRGRGETVDYSLVMRVLRLDCTPGDQVIMKIQWTLLAGPAGKEGVTRVTTRSEKLKDARYDTLVAAVSNSLGEVSREIAREISDRRK